MRVAVAQLVPPVPADDAVLADPAVRPQPVVAVLVQVDGLEYVLLKRDLLCKLTLIFVVLKHISSFDVSSGYVVM